VYNRRDCKLGRKRGSSLVTTFPEEKEKKKASTKKRKKVWHKNRSEGKDRRTVWQVSTVPTVTIVLDKEKEQITRGRGGGNISTALGANRNGGKELLAQGQSN